jgi:hypothetical protein
MKLTHIKQWRRHLAQKYRMDVIELLKSYDTYYSDNCENTIEVQKYCKGDTRCKHKVRFSIKVLSWWAWFQGHPTQSGSGTLHADQIERLFWISGIPAPAHFVGASSYNKRK